MTSRERVLAALQCREPDRVPYCELGIDRIIARKLTGKNEPGSPALNLETNHYSAEEAKAIASVLGMDNIYYILRPPIYAQMETGKDGRRFYGEE